MGRCVAGGASDRLFFECSRYEEYRLQCKKYNKSDCNMDTSVVLMADMICITLSAKTPKHKGILFESYGVYLVIRVLVICYLI